jgi:DNA mismatch endonuclease (patch repair protein)
MDRSANMARIRSTRTKPEMMVRRELHARGFRYRLHRKDLPGRPDLVFPARRKVVFVHGCFWHQHPGCREGRIPGTNRDYWEPKLRRNTDRDEAAQCALRALGWQSFVAWECEIEHDIHLWDRLLAFLASAPSVT